MNENLRRLSKLCFKEQSSGFENLINDYLNKNIEEFQVKYQKLLLNNFDKEDFEDLDMLLSESYLFVIFGRKIQKIHSVDWSGEEYAGEVKKSLTNILKTYNSPTFKWNNRKFLESLNIESLERGELVGLLFREFDKKLNDLGFQMLFIELFDDEYHYTILPSKEINVGLEINDKEFKTYDSKLYEISVIQKPENPSKLMLYLKNKFSLPLNKIREFTENLPIIIECGNILKIKSIEKELKNLDCEYSIIEK